MCGALRRSAPPERSGWSERSGRAERSTGALRRSAPGLRSAPPERSGGTRGKIKKRGGREGPIKLKMTSDRSFGSYRTRQLPVESGCATVRVRTLHSCQLGLGTSPGLGGGRTKRIAKNSYMNYGIIFF